jgi:ElaB/YqjD/DUF883 family membrane-anchored ribosome-binding protein
MADTDTRTRDSAGVTDFANAANQQLKAAGVDTQVMASRAGDLGKMIKDEIAARPWQAVGIAAAVGFIYGLTR